MHPESTESQSKPRDPRALNAYRHGLTGQVHILTPEDQVAYDKHCRDTQQYFNPAGAVSVPKPTTPIERRSHRNPTRFTSA